MSRLLTWSELMAEAWCVVWHEDQKRKYTGEPYRHHPFAVAEIIRSVPHTQDMILAAYMHDLLEDTECPESDMRSEFGDSVTDLVLWLTDVSKPGDGNRETRKRIDREHTAKAPPEAKTIKLADLIDNSQNIVAHDPKFAAVYLREKRLLLDEALREGNPTLWTWADAIVKAGLSGRQVCAGCRSEIDPDCCGCGDEITHSQWVGHSPIPMGCNCGRVK